MTRFSCNLFPLTFPDYNCVTKIWRFHVRKVSFFVNFSVEILFWLGPGSCKKGPSIKKNNQNTVRWFQASFRRVMGALVIWWCLMTFWVIFGVFFDFQKFTKHHRVTSTPKILRKLAWNLLAVFWLYFEKNQSFLFCTVQA